MFLKWLLFALLSRLLVNTAQGQLPAVGQLVWSDEFSGPTDNNWAMDIGGDGWGNAEYEYYTADSTNVHLDGQGHLAIVATTANAAQYTCWNGPCKYTSARLKSSFSRQYGRFEASIQIPTGQGMWPAFWMLGVDYLQGTVWPQCGEIDIMENIGSETTIVHGSLHGGNVKGDYDPTQSFDTGVALSGGFHTYTVDWVADSITWYFDGRQYAQFTRGGTNASPTQWRFNDGPYFMLLNVAVGGTWPGDPSPSTPFPQAMLVDYVRVFDIPTGTNGVPMSVNAVAAGRHLLQTDHPNWKSSSRDSKIHKDRKRSDDDVAIHKAIKVFSGVPARSGGGRQLMEHQYALAPPPHYPQDYELAYAEQHFVPPQQHHHLPRPAYQHYADPNAPYYNGQMLPECDPRTVKEHQGSTLGTVAKYVTLATTLGTLCYVAAQNEEVRRAGSNLLELGKKAFGAYQSGELHSKAGDLVRSLTNNLMGENGHEYAGKLASEFNQKLSTGGYLPVSTSEGGYGGRATPEEGADNIYMPPSAEGRFVNGAGAVQEQGNGPKAQSLFPPSTGSGGHSLI